MAGLDNLRGDLSRVLKHGRDDAEAHGNKGAVKKFDRVLNYLDKVKR